MAVTPPTGTSVEKRLATVEAELARLRWALRALVTAYHPPHEAPPAPPSPPEAAVSYVPPLTTDAEAFAASERAHALLTLIIAELGGRLTEQEVSNAPTPPTR